MYGTVARLREISQVTTEDLFLSPATGQTEDQALDAVLEGLLADATEFINLDRERDFEAEAITFGRPVPRGIINAAYEMASNMVTDLIETQNAKRVSRTENTDLSFTPKNVFTPGVRTKLNLYKKGSELPKSSWPQAARVRTLDEIQGVIV